MKIEKGLILIEGNKGTFKGTLIEELKKYYNFRVIKGIPKGEKSLLKSYDNHHDATKYLFDFWTEIIKLSEKELVVTDRTYISNMVYLGTFTDEDRQFVYLTTEQRKKLETSIKKIPYVLIYLHDTVETLWDRYTLRGTHDILKTDFIQNIEEIEELNRKYDYFMNKETLLDKLDIDCNSFHPQNPKIVKKYLNEKLSK